MAFHMLRLTQKDYVVSQWSGGTTTQIAIAPQGAQYGDRTFLWRLSSATVDLDASDFTPMPDYHRLIAPLKGEMVLTHNGGAPVALRPYQVHAFDGGADTHSEGRCVDFNLMLRKGACQGRIAPVELDGAGSQELDVSPDAEELVLYCVEGGGRVSGAGEAADLQPGEAVRIQSPSEAKLTLECPGAAAFMAAEVYHSHS